MIHCKRQPAHTRLVWIKRRIHQSLHHIPQIRIRQPLLRPCTCPCHKYTSHIRMRGTVERIITGCEGAVAVLSDLSLHVFSAVVQRGDEISARNYLIGRELDE